MNAVFVRRSAVDQFLGDWRAWASATPLAASAPDHRGERAAASASASTVASSTAAATVDAPSAAAAVRRRPEAAPAAPATTAATAATAASTTSDSIRRASTIQGSSASHAPSARRGERRDRDR